MNEQSNERFWPAQKQSVGELANVLERCIRQAKDSSFVLLPVEAAERIQGLLQRTAERRAERQGEGAGEGVAGE